MTIRALGPGSALAGVLVLALTACVPQPTEPVGDVDSKVYKYDGSVQCGGAGTSVDEMARELTNRGIDVLCGQKGNDGYAHCMACGCGSGSINVYVIHPENLGDAEELGFSRVSDLSDYQDEPCTP